MAKRNFYSQTEIADLLTSTAADIENLYDQGIIDPSETVQVDGVRLIPCWHLPDINKAIRALKGGAK